MDQQEPVVTENEPVAAESKPLAMENEQVVPDDQPIDSQHPASTSADYAWNDGVGEGREEQGRDVHRSTEAASRSRSRSRSRDADDKRGKVDADDAFGRHSERRAGDWECPNCGKNVFAFKKTCFNCGTPKPGGVDGARPGDWECPSCFKNVFASRMACFNCGTPKPFNARSTYAPPVNKYMDEPLVTPEGGKPGDWLCPNPDCAEHCFASRNSCRKCGAPKPGSEPQDSGGGSWGGHNAGPGNSRPGDWACPNCSFNCFASRMQCPKCGTNKPGAQQNMWGGDYKQDFPSNYGYAAGYGGMPGQTGQLPPDAKAGDWMCPQCNEHCFASRPSCRKCGTSKPGGYGGGYGGQSHNPMMDQRNKPGDWMCPNPNCRDLCFASRNECRKCGTRKPEGGGEAVGGYGYGGYGMGGFNAGGGGYKDSGVRPGDWSCPKCNFNCFASRQQCPKCGAAKP